jgi:hypothetical protein
MTTIRLDGNYYRINKNGEVQVLKQIKPDIYDDETHKLISYGEMGYVNTKYKIGAECVLYSQTDVSANAIRGGYSKPVYKLSFDLEGISGNSNPNIKRTSEWRGTTDDVSIDAYGIVTIKSIETLKNGDISIGVK